MKEYACYYQINLPRIIFQLVIVQDSDSQPFLLQGPPRLPINTASNNILNVRKLSDLKAGQCHQ